MKVFLLIKKNKTFYYLCLHSGQKIYFIYFVYVCTNLVVQSKWKYAICNQTLCMICLSNDAHLCHRPYCRSPCKFDTSHSSQTNIISSFDIISWFSLTVTCFYEMSILLKNSIDMCFQYFIEPCQCFLSLVEILVIIIRNNNNN